MTSVSPANAEFSGRIIEIDYERSTLLLRYEGMPPEVCTRVEPVAWLVRAPNGNVRLWSQDQREANRFADANGLRVTPLYAIAGEGADSGYGPPLAQGDGVDAAAEQACDLRDALRWLHSVGTRMDADNEGERPDEREYQAAMAEAAAALGVEACPKGKGNCAEVMPDKRCFGCALGVGTPSAEARPQSNGGGDAHD